MRKRVRAYLARTSTVHQQSTPPRQEPHASGSGSLGANETDRRLAGSLPPAPRDSDTPVAVIQLPEPSGLAAEASSVGGCLRLDLPGLKVETSPVAATRRPKSSGVGTEIVASSQLRAPKSDKEFRAPSHTSMVESLSKDVG